jgi:gluconate 5-dehydrogenase
MTLGLFDLNNAVALVTGSSRGLGLVIARGLAGARARVIINGRSPSRVAAAVEALRTEGLLAYPAPFDVTDPDATAAAINRAEEELGPIECLVNNVGVQHRQTLAEVSLEDWRRLIDTNLTSAFVVSRAVAPSMIARGHGKIINVCSVQSDLARPGIAPYAATKGALRMLTRGMCADWGPSGIQANALAPGYFATDLTRDLVADATFSDWLVSRTPAGRWGDPQELVGAAIFLASPASSFVNGQILYVDGGLVSVL